VDRRERITSFREFWPFYVREHAKPLTRRLHFVGTTGVIAAVVVAIATGRWALLVLAPLSGYGFAWAAHLFVEHNRPATFTYPFYSRAADFVMFGQMLSGRMAGEVQRHTRPR
jgi:hypothetical protein